MGADDQGDTRENSGSVRLPEIEHNLAYQLLSWAAEECEQDRFDVEFFFYLLEHLPSDTTGPAGIFWVCHSACEQHLIDRVRIASDEIPTWEQIQRLRDGDDWVQVQSLTDWYWLARLREHPMLRADAFLDWAEPLDRQDPEVVVLYGAALITLLVSEARALAGEDGVLYYHEDLRRILDTVFAANRQLSHSWAALPWPTDYVYYTGEVHINHLDFSLIAASELADLEYAVMQASAGDFPQALMYGSKSVSTLLSGSVLLDEFFIPSHDGAFASESEPGGMINVQSWFEALVQAPETVLDWEDVSLWCRSVADGLEVDANCRLSFGDSVPAWENQMLAYWQQANLLSMTRLSPDQLMRTLRLRDADMHRRRLSEDVLFDTWGDLDKQTRDMLLTLERNWAETLRSPGALADVPNDLRKIFEIELRQCLTPLRDAVDRLLSDSPLCRELSLRSRRFDGVSLGDMAKLLELMVDAKDLRGLSLRTAFDTLPLGDADRTFLTTHVVRYIAPLWQARNDAEHEFRWDPQTVALHRRRALGIDCRGMLPALVRIKRKLNPISRSTKPKGTKR